MIHKQYLIISRNEIRIQACPFKSYINWNCVKRIKFILIYLFILIRNTAEFCDREALSENESAYSISASYMNSMIFNIYDINYYIQNYMCI